MNKLTIKQEKFALKYVELGNASEAYRQSYDAENMSATTITNEAYDLTVHPDIAPRIFKLREELAERTVVTLDKLNARNEYIWELSKQDDDKMAMQKNVESQAKLNGLIIDKQVNAQVDVNELLGTLLGGEEK